MSRTPQCLLIVSWIAFSWLAFMAVHEGGHVLAAWLSGGTVAQVRLHPLEISWTSLSYNPHPQWTAWGGPLFGVVLPLIALAIGRLARMPRLFLLQFFTGFCLVANGLYLFIDSFVKAGDGGTLLRHGAAQWMLISFALVSVPMGFWLWDGLGPHFGLGAAKGEINKKGLAVSVVLLAIVLFAELTFVP